MRTRLTNTSELLDEPHHDRAELEHSLDQVAEVNRLLGGHRAVLNALRPFLRRTRRTRILDVGTGSADIPIAITEWAGGLGRGVYIAATDVHPQMREIAAKRTRPFPPIRVETADALDLPYDDDSFDVVLLSLTLHHFEHDDQIRALREAGRVAARVVIVNELERCRPNYIGSRILAATRWRGNRITRHDGPLSVLRAFKPDELVEIATSAGLRVERIDRRFFFRLVLIADARAARMDG